MYTKEQSAWQTELKRALRMHGTLMAGGEFSPQGCRVSPELGRDLFLVGHLIRWLIEIAPTPYVDTAVFGLYGRAPADRIEYIVRCSRSCPPEEHDTRNTIGALLQARAEEIAALVHHAGHSLHLIEDDLLAVAGVCDYMLLLAARIASNAAPPADVDAYVIETISRFRQRGPSAGPWTAPALLQLGPVAV